MSNASPVIPLGTDEVDKQVWSAFGVSLSITGISMNKSVNNPSDGHFLSFQYRIDNSLPVQLDISYSFVTVNGIVIDLTNINAMGRKADANYSSTGWDIIDADTLQYIGVEHVMSIGFEMTFSSDDESNYISLQTPPITIRTELFGRYDQPVGVAGGQVVLDADGIVVTAMALDPKYDSGLPAILIYVDNTANSQTIILSVDPGNFSTVVNDFEGPSDLYVLMPGGSIGYTGIRLWGFSPGFAYEPCTISLTFVISTPTDRMYHRYPATIKYQ